MCLCVCACFCNLFQDGSVVTPSRLLGDALTVSEAEADLGDGLSRTDWSSGDASRPSSDNADVSIKFLNLYLVFFLIALLLIEVTQIRSVVFLFPFYHFNLNITI
jgi:hypothetical protein